MSTTYAVGAPLILVSSATHFSRCARAVRCGGVKLVGQSQRDEGTMMKPRRILVTSIASVSVSALLIAGAASPASAATWAYPGAVYCSGYTAGTYSHVFASWHTGTIQHRVQGYGGYYQYNWSGSLFASQNERAWGFKHLLSTRVGSQSDGVRVVRYSAACEVL